MSWWSLVVVAALSALLNDSHVSAGGESCDDPGTGGGGAGLLPCDLPAARDIMGWISTTGGVWRTARWNGLWLKLLWASVCHRQTDRQTDRCQQLPILSDTSLSYLISSRDPVDHQHTMIQLQTHWATAKQYVRNPLHTFPRNFPVDGEVANLLQTC